MELKANRRQRGGTENKKKTKRVDLWNKTRLKSCRETDKAHREEED